MYVRALGLEDYESRDGQLGTSVAPPMPTPKTITRLSNGRGLLGFLDHRRRVRALGMMAFTDEATDTAGGDGGYDVQIASEGEGSGPIAGPSDPVSYDPPPTDPTSYAPPPSVPFDVTATPIDTPPPPNDTAPMDGGHDWTAPAIATAPIDDTSGTTAFTPDVPADVGRPPVQIDDSTVYTAVDAVEGNGGDSSKPTVIIDNASGAAVAVVKKLPSGEISVSSPPAAHDLSGIINSVTGFIDQVSGTINNVNTQVKKIDNAVKGAAAGADAGYNSPTDWKPYLLGGGALLGVLLLTRRR